VLRYETSAIERDRGDGFDVDVLPTVLLTLDSAGRPVRRLRERFSLGLATATSGAFEVPDSASPGGWRVTQEFVLIARRVPSR
jgi:hypothetical protein